MKTMKSENIVTLDDLREFLTSYCEEYPEDDCCELIRDICDKNGWIYTADSEDISYDDEDYATDGDHILLWVGNSSRTMVRTLNTMDVRLLLERMARIGTSTSIRAWVRVSTPRMLGR